MLKSAYEARGHVVTMWSPAAKVHRLFAGTRWAKWAGYVDQYVLFPLHVRRALRSISPDALFVFCDQALGPWVPLVRSRPHVVHAHDLLALRSALGDIPENPTSFTGRIYQRYIRRGFRQSRHFISVSKKTRDDLHRFGQVNAVTSEVVYNGLNFPYEPMAEQESHELLRAAGFPPAANGALLHVGGGQWYKNHAGVIAIYAHYVARESDPLPLWCISPTPNAAVQQELRKVGPKGRIHYVQNLQPRTLQAAYSHASAFLCPSLEEGFGWPLIEAQACGCPVITTNAPPMSEVGGDAAIYIPRLETGEDVDSWASMGASALRNLLSEPADARSRRAERGRLWAAGFDAGRSTDAYLAIYSKVLEFFSGQSGEDLILDESR
jgi:glycosyltransferase involved in cell wall biosynthesis